MLNRSGIIAQQLNASQIPDKQISRKKENRLKIRILIPTGEDQSTLDRLRSNYTQASNAKSEINFTFLSNGPELDAPYNEIATFLPDLIFKIKEAEREGVQAVVIAHYLDPGLEAGRELVSIPVIGSGHTTFRLASALTHRISIITSVHSHLGPIEDIVAAEGVSAKVVSIRSVEIARGDAQKFSQQSPDQLLRLSQEAVEKDGAKLIILALQGYDDFSNQVKEYLALRGNPVPVLDPLKIAIKHAENLVDMGLSHSKITYPHPEIREIIGYGHLQFK
jgi:allantoin racemase